MESHSKFHGSSHHQADDHGATPPDPPVLHHPYESLMAKNNQKMNPIFLQKLIFLKMEEIL